MYAISSTLILYAVPFVLNIGNNPLRFAEKQKEFRNFTKLLNDLKDFNTTFWDANAPEIEYIREATRTPIELAQWVRLKNSFQNLTDSLTDLEYTGKEGFSSL